MQQHKVPINKGGEGVVMSLDERYNQLTNCYPEFISGSPANKNQEILKQPVKQVQSMVQHGELDDAIQILSTFDPYNALGMDIAREFLHKLPMDILNSNQMFKILNDILKSGHQYPKVELNGLITLQKNFIEIEDDKEYKLITCKLHGQGVVFRESIFGRDIKTKKQQVVKANQLLVAEIDAKNGGYGVIPAECDGAIVSSHYYIYSINQNELLPEYLSLVLTNKDIEDQVSAYVRGTTSYAAIRPNDFLNIKIPLPSIEKQEEIVEALEGVRLLRQEAKRRIERIIAEVWEEK